MYLFTLIRDILLFCIPHITESAGLLPTHFGAVTRILLLMKDEFVRCVIESVEEGKIRYKDEEKNENYFLFPLVIKRYNTIKHKL